MNPEPDSSSTDSSYIPELESFPERLKEAMQGESVRSFSRKLGVSDTGVGNYLTGKSRPGLKALLKIAEATDTTVEWLATGRGMPNPGVIEVRLPPDFPDDKYTLVPLYDVTAKAGNGHINGWATVIRHFVHERNWLSGEWGIPPEAAYFIRSAGDSMVPAILPNELVLVDGSVDAYAGDGVYVFTIGDELLVKNLQRIPGQGLEVSSRNPAFKSFILTESDVERENVRIVGRPKCAIPHCRAI